MSSRSDDAAGRPLSKQPCGTFVVTSQATSLVGDGVSRLLLAPCLRRHHNRRGSRRFCQGFLRPAGAVMHMGIRPWRRFLRIERRSYQMKS